MAEQSPTKRDRVEIAVPSFTAVDLETFTMKDNGKGTNGHRAFPLVGGEPIRFNLMSDDWLKTVFGFDITTKFEKPSFLGGKQPENGASEGLALRINLEKTQAEFLKQLDEKSQEGFIQSARQEQHLECSRKRRKPLRHHFDEDHGGPQGNGFDQDRRGSRRQSRARRGMGFS